MLYLILSLKLLLLVILPLHAEEKVDEKSNEKIKEIKVRKIKSPPKADGVFYGMEKGPMAEYLAGYEYLNDHGQKRFVKMSVHSNSISTQQEAASKGVGMGWGVKF